MDTLKWQIIKCWYDPVGMGCNEIEDPERMQLHKDRDDYGDFGYFIGIVHENDSGRKITQTILEGRKKVLEFIIKTVNP